MADPWGRDLLQSGGQQAAPAAAPPSAPASAPAPWAKYSSTGTGIRESKASSYPTTPTNPKVIQEQHPDIGTGDRLFAENFAAGEPDKVRYLKEQHQNLEIKQDPQDAGQILIRGPGESDYRVLVPKVFSQTDRGSLDQQNEQGVVEGFKRLGDNIVPAVAGIASGIGAAGGAAIGALGGPAAPLTVPLGAVAGGALTGALGEGARQEIGQMLGVNKDLDPDQIKLAALMGGLGPVAFGAKAIGSAAGVGEMKGAIPKALGYLRENVAPKIGSFTSGVSESAINAAKKYLPDFPEMAANGVKSIVTGARDTADQLLAMHSQNAGEKLGQVVDTPGVKIDLTSAEQQLKDYLAQLQNLKDQKATPGIQAKIANVEEILKEHFGGLPEARPTVVGEEPHPLYPEQAPPPPSATGASSPLPGTFTPKGPTTVSGARAWDLKKDLDALAKLHETPQIGTAPSTSVAKSQSNRAIKKASLDIGGQLDDQTGGAFSAANERFSDLRDIEDNLAKFFGRNDTTGQPGYSKLTNAFKEANAPQLETLREIDKALPGSNLEETANKLQAYKQFNDPGIHPVSGGGTTSTTVTNTMGNIFDALVPRPLAKAARAVSGAVSGPAALKTYMKAGARGSSYLNDPSLWSQLYSPATASAWTMLQGQGGNAP